MLTSLLSQPWFRIIMSTGTQFIHTIEMYPQGRMTHRFQGDACWRPSCCKVTKDINQLSLGHIWNACWRFRHHSHVPSRKILILENPTNKTTVHLIYANVTYKDILLKEELEI